MQTLGLSSVSRRSDGWVKSLLWPSVENAWDVDYLGQQGMWICTVLAVATLIFSAISANPVLILIGSLSACFYLLGGMGIREANWPAAALVFAVYSVDILVRIASVQMPSIFSIVFAIVLLSNLRAAFLASEWRPLGPDEDRPTRFSETLADKYVDQLPRRLWPKLHVAFLVFGIAFLLLSLTGLATTVVHRFMLAKPR
jgi:hypothetical protein